MRPSLTREEIEAGRAVLARCCEDPYPQVRALVEFAERLLEERSQLLDWGYEQQDRANQMVQLRWAQERGALPNFEEIGDALVAQVAAADEELARLRGKWELRDVVRSVRERCYSTDSRLSREDRQVFDAFNKAVDELGTPAEAR